MSAPIVPIRAIQWGLLTGEQWKRYAVVKVTKPSPKISNKSNLKEGRKDKNAGKDWVDNFDGRLNTPYDPRLGEQSDNVPCETCGKDNFKCPGHFGYIELPFPIYNKQYIHIVLKLLQCVCKHCARPRILTSHLEIQGINSQEKINKLKIFAEKCKPVRTCPWENCGEPMIFYSTANKKKGETDTHLIYYTVEINKNADREPFSAAEACDVLSRISFEDLQSIGFNSNLLPNEEYRDDKYLMDYSWVHTHQVRPEAMIYTVIPVIPTLARPYIQDENEIREDDLTGKINDIIKSVNLYNSFDTKSSSLISKNTVSTRKHVKTKADVERDVIINVWSLIDNKEENKKQKRGNKVRKTITCRLIGKDGRIQQNVAGKRVNYSARTVIIGGGTELKNDEFGIPQDIAEIETKTRFVCAAYLEEAQNLVRNGKVNKIIRVTYNEKTNSKENTTINLTNFPDKGRSCLLQIGDTIHRHLQNGDPVFVNRQPTLRDESMITFRAKIIEGMAFRLPLAFTKGLNADFDGEDFEEKYFEILLSRSCHQQVA